MRLSSVRKVVDSPLTWGIVLTFLAGMYLLAYFYSPFCPTNQTNGWWKWWDQGHYLKSALGISHLNVNSGNYWYPLGYPALGALFARLLPAHPFLIPDLGLFMGIAVLFWKICRVWFGRVGSALLGIAVLVVLRQELIVSLVIPWNTIPTHFLAYLAIYLVLTRSNHRPSDTYPIALICGIAYLFRPSDALFLVPILFFPLFSSRSIKEAARSALFSVLIVGVFVVATGLLNLHIFGTWNSPYETVARDKVGFDLANLLRKAYGVFINGSVIDGTTDPMLLQRMPWLIWAPFGAFLALVRLKWRFVGVAGSIALCFLTYLAFNDFYPYRLYGWLLIHYLTWTLPLLALLAAVFIKNVVVLARKRPTAAMALTVVMLASWFAVCSVRLQEADVVTVLVAGDGRLSPLEPLKKVSGAFDVLQFRQGKVQGQPEIKGRIAGRFHDYYSVKGRFYFTRPVHLQDLSWKRGSNGKTLYARLIRLKWTFRPSIFL